MYAKETKITINEKSHQAQNRGVARNDQRIEGVGGNMYVYNSGGGDTPKDMEPHTAHTSTVVRSHSGARTIAIRSNQAQSGLRNHLGSFQYILDLTS